MFVSSARATSVKIVVATVIERSYSPKAEPDRPLRFVDLESDFARRRLRPFRFDFFASSFRAEKIEAMISSLEERLRKSEGNYLLLVRPGRAEEIIEALHQNGYYNLPFFATSQWTKEEARSYFREDLELAE